MSGGTIPQGGIVQSYTYGFAAGSANREDLLDLITNIDPWDTPFYSSAPKVDCRHTTHEWLTDTLSATTVVGAIEGADFSADSTTTRPRLNNSTQIFRYDILVSDTTRMLNPAGVRDEYEYQVLKATRQIARNIEATILQSASTLPATGATGTARTLRNFRSFTGTNYAVPITSVAGAITFQQIIGVHELIYTSGGNPDTLYVSPGVKADLTLNLVGSVAPGARMNLNIALADKKVIQNVDVIESDYGMLAVVPDRFVPQCAVTGSANLGGAAFLVERSKARIATLRPIRHTPLGKNGDSTRGIILGELTLEVLHPSAHAFLVNIST